MYCKSCNRWYALERNYGVTQSWYEETLESQNYKCAVCGSSEPGGKGVFHVDHDHACCGGVKSCGNCVRGLLCSRCNSLVVPLVDNPVLLAKANNYLKRWSVA